MYESMDRLFGLRIRTHFGNTIQVTAFDRAAPAVNPYGHSYIDIEVKQGKEIIFPRGQLYCGVNAWTSTDGNAAKELVLSTVAMKPGDTDSDYFRDYTPDQLAWASEFGDLISCERESRYCDIHGEVRGHE